MPIRSIRWRSWTKRAFDALLAAIASEDLRQRWQDLREGRVDAAKVEDSKTKVAQFAERVETQLSDGRAWLMEDFSIADLETFAWLRPMRDLEAAAFAGKDRCIAWMDRVEARPSVQAALARATADIPSANLRRGRRSIVGVESLSGVDGR